MIGWHVELNADFFLLRPLTDSEETHNRARLRVSFVNILSNSVSSLHKNVIEFSTIHCETRGHSLICVFLTILESSEEYLKLPARIHPIPCTTVGVSQLSPELLKMRHNP